MKKIIFTLLTAAIALSIQSSFARHKQPDNVSSKPKPKEKSSLVFIENNGQIKDQYGKIRNDIDFKLDGGDINIFIGTGKLEYQWVVAANESGLTTYRMDVQLAGISNDIKLNKSEKSVYKEYYYNDIKDVAVESYRKIVYENIYPNIDWVLYIENGKSLKYDFIVHEKGRYSDIKITYKGTDGLSLDNEGNLNIKTLAGTVTEKSPLSYVLNNGAKQIVASNYALNAQQLSFNIAEHVGKLVIDPEIEWATFYGGDTIGGDGKIKALRQQVNKSTIDNKGNVFIGGASNAINNIATTGTFLQTLSSNRDFFVVKFNDKGERLWGTYYFGTKKTATRSILDLQADHSGNVYFTTDSKEYFENFCTPGAHQDTIVTEYGHADLVKLSADGQRLWATYYGSLQPTDAGNGATLNGVGITVDLSNNVFLIGLTMEKNNFDYGGIYNIIATKGAHKEEHTQIDFATRDIFVVKFDSVGTRQWGTYYGGAKDDLLGRHWSGGGAGKVTATDSEGNVYIIGYTRSDDGISTKGAFKENLSLDNEYNDDQDAYLAKFSPTGELLWATYYGGVGTIDEFVSVDVDAEDNVILLGRTISKDGIATSGSFQDTLNYAFTGRYTWNVEARPAFLAKFDKHGNRLWGSYFYDPNFDKTRYGANWDVSPLEIKVDNYNNYWILFSTHYEADFYKKGTQWSTYEQRAQNVLMQFSGTGDSVVWSSYIDASFQSLNIDHYSNLYMAGMANETSSASPGAHQEEYKPSSGYLLKSNVCEGQSGETISPTNFQSEEALCPNSTVVYSVATGFSTYTWELPTGWQGSSDSNSIEVTVNDQSGTISVSGTYQCGTSGKLEVAIEVIKVDDLALEAKGDTLFAPSGYDNYQWFFNDKKLENTNNYILLNESGVYKVVAGKNENCAATGSYTYQKKVGLNDITLVEIVLSPNPASTFIHINYANPAIYSLLDVQGRYIKSSQENTIPVHDLTNGVYVLRVQDLNGNIIKHIKFIKDAQ